MQLSQWLHIQWLRKLSNIGKGTELEFASDVSTICLTTFDQTVPLLLKKTKKIFHLPKLSQKCIEKRTFRLEKGHIFYILDMHTSEWLHSTRNRATSLWHLCQTPSKNCFVLRLLFLSTSSHIDSNPKKLAPISTVQVLFLSSNVFQYGPDVSGRYFVA